MGWTSIRRPRFFFVPVVMLLEDRRNVGEALLSLIVTGLALDELPGLRNGGGNDSLLRVSIAHPSAAAAQEGTDDGNIHGLVDGVPRFVQRSAPNHSPLEIRPSEPAVTASTSSLDRLFSQPGIDDSASEELLAALSRGSRGSPPPAPVRYSPPERPPAAITPLPSTEPTQRDGPSYRGPAIDPLGGGFFGPEGNHPPDAVQDEVVVDEDNPINIAVLANDTDPDGDPLSVASVTQPANGAVTLEADNTVTYTPNENWWGLDQFTYTISDGFGGTDTADIWVLVLSVNDFPEALNYDYTIQEDTPLIFDPVGDNIDPDSDRLTLLHLGEPLYGKLYVNDDETITYQPDGDFNSLDADGNLTVVENFTYTIWDRLDGEATGQILIIVEPVQDVPFAYDDALVIGLASTDPPVPSQASFGFDILLRNDIDYDYRDPNYDLADWDITAISGPVDVYFEDRYFIYHVPPIEGCEVVQETITYTVSDGIDTATATAYLFLTPICACPPDDPDCPMEPPPLVATDDEVVVDDDSVSGNVLSNDEEASLAILATVPAVGRLAPFSSSGAFTYLADVNFRGEVLGLFWLNPQTGYVAATTVVYLAYAQDGRAAGANLRLLTYQAHLRFAELPRQDRRLPGGLVVKYADNNHAPRQKIILEKADIFHLNGLPETPDAIWVRLTIAPLIDPKVKLFTEETGGTPLTFGANGTANFQNWQLPMPFWVEGASESGEMRDVEIRAYVTSGGGTWNGKSADWIKTTVLWVNPIEIKFDGPISLNNDKRNAYKIFTEEKTFNLGVRNYTRPDVSDQGRFGWGLEASGLVHPAKFRYPGSDLQLGRDIQSRWYDESNNLIPPPTYVPQNFTDPIPPGNDTHQGEWARRHLLDNNPEPDNKIYDWDAPGIWRFPRFQGAIQRARFNFKVFAQITIGNTLVRASLVRTYFVRFSAMQINPGFAWNWAVINLPDVVGDNEAKYDPFPSPITWDLQ